MKTKIILLAATVTVMTLTSCKSLFNFTTITDQAMGIQRNMTMEDVRDIMGDPRFRSFEQDIEKWEYRTRVLDNDNDVVSIMFRGGKVISMNSFREIHPIVATPNSEKKTK